MPSEEMVAGPTDSKAVITRSGALGVGVGVMLAVADGVLVGVAVDVALGVTVGVLVTVAVAVTGLDGSHNG